MTASLFDDTTPFLPAAGAAAAAVLPPAATLTVGGRYQAIGPAPDSKLGRNADGTPGTLRICHIVEELPDGDGWRVRFEKGSPSVAPVILRKAAHMWTRIAL